MNSCFLSSFLGYDWYKANLVLSASQMPTWISSLSSFPDLPTNLPSLATVPALLPILDPLVYMVCYVTLLVISSSKHWEDHKNHLPLIINIVEILLEMKRLQSHSIHSVLTTFGSKYRHFYGIWTLCWTSIKHFPWCLCNHRLGNTLKWAVRVWGRFPTFAPLGLHPAWHDIDILQSSLHTKHI